MLMLTVTVVKPISSVHPTGNDQLTAYHTWVDQSIGIVMEAEVRDH